MKRSEMINYIESELSDIIGNYNIAEGHEKRQGHIIINGAAGILDMLEGFGMLPPEISDPKGGYRLYDTGVLNEWELEDEKK